METPAPTPTRVLITVDKAAQRLRVTVYGKLRHSWAVSTGRAHFETPTGTFRPLRLAKVHYSREWDDAPMPHSIFFTGRGHAIHGSNATRSLGRRASHGCVPFRPQCGKALCARQGRGSEQHQGGRDRRRARADPHGAACPALAISSAPAIPARLRAGLRRTRFRARDRPGFERILVATHANYLLVLRWSQHYARGAVPDRWRAARPCSDGGSARPAAAERKSESGGAGDVPSG